MPICWPFFENCFHYRFFDIASVQAILVMFGIAALIGMFLFLPRKYVSFAFWWMVGVNIFKALIWMQDFRLRANQHYMLFFVTIVFLFFPQKRKLIPLLIILFYFWAGTVKWNYEWLSGSALIVDPLWIHGMWIPIACAYVIVLECVLIFGLMSKKRWLQISTFIQLLLFHLVSVTVVGFFYPMLMFALLMIFPLIYVISPEKESLWSYFRRGCLAVSTYILLLVFSLLQFVPIVILGNEKVTGEGRLFALHMIDAAPICDGAITLKFADGRQQEITLPLEGIQTRIKCDPIVNFSHARWHCFKKEDDSDFIDLDLKYDARQGSDPELLPLVDISNLCSQNLQYTMFGRNEWILNSYDQISLHSDRMKANLVDKY